MAPSDPASAVAPLLARELDNAGALVQAAGWNQVAADWRIFLELGTVHAVRDAASRVIATAATLPHDGRFAWISMVLVDPAHRRQGLATRLLQRCIDEISSAGLVAILDATPDGREVYRELGFEDCWGYHRLTSSERGRLPDPGVSDISVRPIDDAVWPRLCAYDSGAFGANREAILKLLRGRLPQAGLYAERYGNLCGFVLGRDGRLAAHLGPLIADDDDIARALLRSVLLSLSDPLFIDLADAKSGIREMLETLGFKLARPLTRMLLRRRERFDDPQRTYAVVGPEFG